MMTFEALTFLIFAIIGFLLGALYDIFRLFRRIIKSGIIFIFIQDVIYFLLFSMITFFLILAKCNDGIRGFLLVGELLGLLLYFSTIGNLTTVWIDKLRKFIYGRTKKYEEKI